MQNILFDPHDQMDCPYCGQKIPVSTVPPFKRIPCPHCRHAVHVPGWFGPYTLKDHLGDSVSSGLYLASDPVLGRDVTLKILMHVLSKSPELVEAFRREALAAAALNSANVLRVYEYGIHNHQPYMVMEHVQGEFLHVIAQRGHLSEPRVLEIAEGIIQGLADTHQCGIVHGEITPRNILLDSQGTPKLCDFGLAHFQHEKSALIDTWSSPYYMPPERILGRSEDHRSDFYSLGTTLFYLLTDHLPFFDLDDEVVRHRKKTEAPPDPREFRPDLTPEFAELIRMMLHRDIRKRPADYPELFTLLDQVREAMERAGKKRPPPEGDAAAHQSDSPPPPPPGRFVLPGALLAAALFLILIFTRQQSVTPPPILSAPAAAPTAPDPAPAPPPPDSAPLPADPPVPAPPTLPPPTEEGPEPGAKTIPEVSLPLWDRTHFFHLPDPPVPGPMLRWMDGEEGFLPVHAERSARLEPNVLNRRPALRFHQSPYYSNLFPGKHPEFTLILVAKFPATRQDTPPQVLVGIDPYSAGVPWFLLRHLSQLPGSLIAESPRGTARLILTRSERDRPFVAAFIRDTRGDQIRVGPHRLTLSGQTPDPQPLPSPTIQSLQLGGLMDRELSFTGHVAELHLYRRALSHDQLDILFQQLEKAYGAIP